MNRTQIGWCDYSWNPVTGCKHNCAYCYARRFIAKHGARNNDFSPAFFYYRLNEPGRVKTPKVIFAGSMADMLGRWKWDMYSSQYVCMKIAEAMQNAPQHEYIVLTKANLAKPEAKANAERLMRAGAHIGVSIDGRVTRAKYAVDRPRVYGLNQLENIEGSKKILCVEPMLGKPAMRQDDFENIDWLIIGGLTAKSEAIGDLRKNRKVLPYAKRLVRMAQKADVPIYVKENFTYLQEYKDNPIRALADDTAKKIAAEKGTGNQLELFGGGDV